jgi:hypothetical protein
MKIFCSTLAIFAFALFPAFGETNTDITIEKITSDSVESSVPAIGTDTASQFTVMEVFDVYEKSEMIDSEKTYSGYVDSVYLESIKYVKTDGAYKLVFKYVWEGEDKYIEKGFILVPTGRKFEIDKTDIKLFAQTRYIEDQRASADESRQLLNLYLNSGCIFNINMEKINSLYSAELKLECMARFIDIIAVRANIASGRNFGQFDFSLSAEYHYTFIIRPVFWSVYLGVGKTLLTMNPQGADFYQVKYGTCFDLREPSNIILNHLFIDLSYFIKYSMFMMPSEIAFELKLGYRLI